ncbi:MAG TPA: HAD hydrolase-like protein, partial [Candidatus Aminicenantes bacterium]|nr:HAD hydrolase-like protein [Candidatus Aminicenantes bacterium]
MVLKAASDYSLTLQECFLIGDKLSDLKTAWAVGSTALLVLTGEGRKTLADLTGEEREKSHVFETLLDAARWICRRGSSPLKLGENP